jgi:hypothetical protein
MVNMKKAAQQGVEAHERRDPAALRRDLAKQAAARAENLRVLEKNTREQQRLNNAWKRGS